MARKTRRRSRSRKQRGGNPEEVEQVDKAEAEVESMDNEMTGGAKRKKGRKSRRKTRKGKKGKKKSRKKRKLNPFFKLMLAAKKKGAASFKYNGHTYKGKKHPRLGMIYKKA